MASDSQSPLLSVRHLSKHFALGDGMRGSKGVFKAVDDVSFDLYPGEILGLVGESGSGKTTVARCILRALTPTTGSILYRSQDTERDLAVLTHRQLKPLRREMQMIFQDPFSSLNPRMTVGQIVAEPLAIHGIGNRAQRRIETVEMLERVGLQADHMTRYPHAFSGGQRQRIGIARALILRPRLIIADEAVSALDVSVQAQILDLLVRLQKEMNLTSLFVSHDLSVIHQICRRVIVMYRGKVMETASVDDLFTKPRHAYTRVLLSAIPSLDPTQPMNPLKVSDLEPSDLLPLPRRDLDG